MAQTARFQVTYDGPALTEHTMDVRDLAPALLALGEVFEAANRAVGDRGTEVKLAVRGNFQSGSFAVELMLAQTWLDTMLTWGKAQDAQSINTLVQLVVGTTTILATGAVGVGGLISLLKRLGGRQPTKAEELNDGTTRLTLADGTTVETDSRVVVLLKDHAVRTGLDRAVRGPLARDGINTFAAVSQDDAAAEPVMVTEDEASSFEAPPPVETPLQSHTVETWVRIHSLAFKAGNKWQLNDGSATFYATIEDPRFLDGVEHSAIRFGKDDVMRVRMRVEQSTSVSGLKAEHFVEEVLEHKQAAVQADWIAD